VGRFLRGASGADRPRLQGVHAGGVSRTSSAPRASTSWPPARPVCGASRPIIWTSTTSTAPTRSRPWRRRSGPTTISSGRERCVTSA
jgi:hypothetical protein